MANNQYVNKVLYNDSTLIDLTGDTVTPESLLSGYTAHDRSGAPINGSVVIPTKISDLQDDVGYLVEDNIANNLTSTDPTEVLAAPQGKTLNDKIIDLPNTIYSSYNVLIDTVQISQTETVYTLYGSRKFSDYNILYITPMVEFYFRPGCVIPRSSFAGNSNGTSFTYPSGGINVEVVIKYESDTQVKMKYNASSVRDVRIYLGALKLEY